VEGFQATLEGVNKVHDGGADVIFILYNPCRFGVATAFGGDALGCTRTANVDRQSIMRGS
jgi:hypothetical protein